MGKFLLFVLALALVGSSTFLFHGTVLGFAPPIIVLAAGAVFLVGLKQITADPPHSALVTFLGKMTNKVKRHGWRFFLFYPWLYSFIPIRVTKIDFDLEPQAVRTPDLAESEVPVSLTIIPDDDSKRDIRKEITDPKRLSRILSSGEIPLIRFIRSGRDKGVEGILTQRVQERLRVLALSAEEGPQTWSELQGSGEDIISVLLRRILGEELPRIRSSVPTRLLLRYFSVPPKGPTETQKGEWGPVSEKSRNRWGKLETQMQEDAKNADYNPDALPWQQYRDRIVRADVAERRRDIETVMQGNGGWRIHDLGIKLLRLNVGAIKLLGDAAKAAEKRVIEEQERTAETVELQHVAARATALTLPKEQGGLGITPAHALRVVQSERGKITATADEKVITIDPETREALPHLAELLVKPFVDKKG